LTVDGVATALLELKGNKSAVARGFKVTRSAVQKFIRTHPELIEVSEDCKEGFVDDVESAIYAQALNGNVTAQIFILKTLGKRRGYVERTEHEVTTKNDRLRAIVQNYRRDVLQQTGEAITWQQAIVDLLPGVPEVGGVGGGMMMGARPAKASRPGNEHNVDFV
jgi:hypothetical protein